MGLVASLFDIFGKSFRSFSQADNRAIPAITTGKIKFDNSFALCMFKAYWNANRVNHLSFRVKAKFRFI